METGYCDKLGGPKDLIVEGVTGLKVLGRSPEQHVDMLGSAIDQLIGDSELRRRMGSAAASRVRDEFVWQRLAERYEQLYGILS